MQLGGRAYQTAPAKKHRCLTSCLVPSTECSWAGLLSGRAYQNYPSDAYADPQRPYKPQEMYFGDNLCRLVAVKNK